MKEATVGKRGEKKGTKSHMGLSPVGGKVGMANKNQC